MILQRTQPSHLHYFLLISLIVHGVLIAAWQIDEPGSILEPGNTLAVVLQTNTASETPDDESHVQKKSAQILRSKPPAEQRTSSSIQFSQTSGDIIRPVPVRDALPPKIIEQPATPESATPTTFTDTAVNRHNTEPHIAQQLRQALIQYFTYPLLARKHGWEGTVGLGVHIAADGRLSHIHVARSSGYGILDRAAVASLQQVTAIPEATTWLGNHDLEIIFPVEYQLIDG
jgi:TonB family protein